MNFYNQKNQFIFVNINDERIKLYDNDHLTVVDAAMQIGFPNDALFPRRGKSLNFTLNDTAKMIRGNLGEAAVITINGHEANINAKIAKNDKIYIKESTAGEPATYTVGQLAEYKESISFIVNDLNVTCPKFADVNGSLVPASYQIQENDIINIRDYYSVEQLLKFMDIDMTGKSVKVNGNRADMDVPVYGGFKVTIEDVDYLNEPTEDDNVAILDESQMEVKTDIQSNVNSVDMQDSRTDKPSDDVKKKEAAPENKAEQPTQQQPQEKPAGVTTSEAPMDIVITVNGKPVILKNKKSYIFVDILDFYPFDTRTAGGSELIIKVNEQVCTFMTPLSNGDAAEIYWKA